MMRRLAGVGICVLVALAVVMPGSASAAKAPVELTIKPWEPIGLGVGVWKGRVKSTRTKCMRDAKVTLYYSTGEDNEALGDAQIEKSNGKFFWGGVTDEPDDGTYFAVAKPTGACKRAESKHIEWPDNRR